ncbi:hypothetical protein [Mangrovibacterium diazotrophicum]|nr:hypothetical protein [Mangrovibacterium diazotrophicum]
MKDGGMPAEIYKSVFVVALVPNKAQRFAVEEKMVQAIRQKGHMAEKSSDWFPSGFTADEELSKEAQLAIIKKAGCDGILTLSQLDTKTESHYVQGTVVAPLPPYRFRYYGSYYPYYNYRYSQIYDPGYVTQETTYFFETNFYDTASEDLLWSIQSSAFEPTDLDSWFKGYESLIVEQLQKEGLLKD